MRSTPATLGAVVVAAIAVIVLALATGTGIDPLHRRRTHGLTAARSLLGDDSRFGNGPHAATTFASISERLLDDAKSCERHRAKGADDPRCAARLEGAAWSQVAAAALLGCTAPGVYDARVGLRRYLAAVADLDHRRPVGASRPMPPSLPRC